jgi:hypothetical protein
MMIGSCAISFSTLGRVKRRCSEYPDFMSHEMVISNPCTLDCVFHVKLRVNESEQGTQIHQGTHRSSH